MFMPTLREDPNDTVAISHKLMLRAGMVKQVSAGIYTWLPLGLRVLRKVENIIREEMDRTGAHEVLMPAVQPSELWKESARWNHFGPELFRLSDRHEREYCLGPTHEEVITDLIRKEISSYKQLPLNLYQIQTKFRDEIRPRFGVIRAREFIMKDAYSFHENNDSLNITFNDMHNAYTNILNRVGLIYRSVSADPGAIGGSGSQEFHVLANSGEDDIVFSHNSNYGANIEMAVCKQPVEPTDLNFETLRLVDTPNQKTIDGIVSEFNIPIESTVKTLIVEAKPVKGTKKFVALLLRGDHSLNRLKAEKHPMIKAPLTFAERDEIFSTMGAAPGSLGPKDCPITVIADLTVASMNNFCAGANKDGKHFFGLNWERDIDLPLVFDLRNACQGDLAPDGSGPVSIQKGIEVGHIFKLGTKYSEALGATITNSNSKKIPISMGCYGIGVTRIVAAAIEQSHDKKGIIWPFSIAPFQVAIVPIGEHRDSAITEKSVFLTKELEKAGFEVFLDNRNLGPGQRFADIDLIGIPVRLVVSNKTLKIDSVEWKNRNEDIHKDIKISQVIDIMKNKFKDIQ